MKLSTTILYGICLLSQLSCLNDAERRNPLDPKSENFKNESNVSGRILTFYQPFVTLSGAEIELDPGAFVSKADAEGGFLIRNVPPGEYTISARKEGFAVDSDTITVRLGETTFIELNLDALPLIESVSINSCHISRNFPQNDLFFLEVAATVGDPDGVGDIDFVEIEIPEINYLDTLDVTQTPGVFMKIIPESQLPVGNFMDILGRQIFLNALDRPGFKSSSQAKMLARIIEKTPLTNSPNQGETLNDATPLLEWRSAELLFDFKYRVEVVRVDFGLNTPVWSQPDIDKTNRSIAVSDSLASGVYFWTVSVVDKFGNWSRSKEAPFRIN
ncbi:carboxypeptidase regulatory-like domain-containing protein [candidate division KSB1 bacterium]|nr:carboxypeptidase regulatory-like domain-containing protein [candidate division KSB1 bacterium]